MLMVLEASRATPSPHAPGSSAAARKLPSVPAPDSSDRWWLLPGSDAALYAAPLDAAGTLASPTCREKRCLDQRGWKHAEQTLLHLPTSSIYRPLHTQYSLPVCLQLRLRLQLSTCPIRQPGPTFHGMARGITGWCAETQVQEFPHVLMCSQV